MRVLVNGLSIRGLSGKHVVHGFLRQLIAWTDGEHEFAMLNYESERDSTSQIHEKLQFIPAPQSAHNWLMRSAWEISELPRIVRKHRIDLVFAPAGAIAPRCPVPQVVLAMNPWCLVDGIRTGAVERFKAGVQRRAYKHAMKNAAMMYYISDHLRGLYRKMAGGALERESDIAYPALDEQTVESAARCAGRIERRRNQILSVSVMAPWKGIDNIVLAVSQLRSQGVDAELKLVGPWPRQTYENQIKNLIREHRLEDAVEITGKVGSEQLHHCYAEAGVFCLMSKCESYGIPAAEAQCFGTPVVGSDCCAMPEICGEGGVFVPPDDRSRTAEALAPLLSDDTVWKKFSNKARENSLKYRWEHCTQPLMKMFSVV